MEKAYNHTEFESNIYKKWEKSGAFAPSDAKETFTIIMPPPNANDPLHVGHARFVAVEDTLIRYARLKGLATLWIPGSDHAGIETQFVFEKRLREKGKSRFDYDRETLYKMIWDYVQDNTGVMEKQLKALGASCDWSRHKFTLDPDIQSVVHSTFKKLYDDGLVYRGERIVNYCPVCGTNFSELEVNYEEREDLLYYLDYKTITIATTRPETIFADVAIAVNPRDERYKKLIGKTAVIPLINREIPIISDSAVEKDFGTGALKITPGHDPLDFEIGQRHNLSAISVIDQDGKMTNTPKEYIGMKAKNAREAVAEKLEEVGSLKKKQAHTHSVGRCYRCKTTIEPLLSKQWFITMKPLAKRATESIKNGSVTFAAKKHEKQALHWLKNIRDWNVSRQIVWGMKIPAFRCNTCLEWHITDGKKPKKCSCGSTSFTQDTDTFDTWFSSGQWPFATLKTTKKGDFERFYPTQVMNTSYDIILFWVIRMIMLGLYVTDDVPFENVVIHGLVRDKQGLKISKSKGNVIDPMEMVEKYGSDALRMGLLWGALIENDISLSEDNIRGQRNFANKLWNVARFISMDTNITLSKVLSRPKTTDAHDKDILKKLDGVIKKVDTKMEKYKISEAVESIYNFVWNDLASEYLESIKSRKEDALPTLSYVLQNVLIITHPFMPFVTEAIWTNFNETNLLINASWPQK